MAPAESWMLLLAMPECPLGQSSYFSLNWQSNSRRLDGEILALAGKTGSLDGDSLSQ